MIRYMVTFMIVGQFSEFREIKAHDMASALSLAMIHSTQFRGKHIHEVRVREIQPEPVPIPAIVHISPAAMAELRAVCN